MKFLGLLSEGPPRKGAARRGAEYRALVAAAVAGAVLLAFSPVFAQNPAPGRPGAARKAPAVATSEASVQLGRLHYGGGGDWYANPTSLPNLAKALRDRLGMDVEIADRHVQPLDEELFETPFLHMTGHGNVRFTPEEVERLRLYLLHGGFLYADDNYGMDEFFRREVRKIFPDAELVELPFDHEIYHAVYRLPHGLPKIHEHHGGQPHGYGIFHEGRMVIFYSYNTDIGDGLEDPEVHGDPADVRESALQMAMNVVVYAMTH